MVISWLLNFMHKSISDSVIFCDTASEIWKELNEHYGQSNKGRHFQAQKEVRCISHGDLDMFPTSIRPRKFGTNSQLSMACYGVSARSVPVMLMADYSNTYRNRKLYGSSWDSMRAT